MTVAGVGNAAKFQPADEEIRFSFRFEVLERDAAGKVIQRGVCTLPDGRKLSLTVNDEKGASTPEGDVRVFAGLRSDPFYLAWIAATLKKVPNLLQHNNVLCMVVEFDTRRVLDPAKGSLFGAIAETVPISKQRDPHRTSSPPHRLGRTPRADQHTAQQSRDVGDRRYTRPVESADAVRDLRRSCSRCSCSA